MTSNLLVSSLLETPLGQMVAVANERALTMLEFTDRKGLEVRLKKMEDRMSWGRTPPIESIEKELEAYFEQKLTAFKTPIEMNGTPFQKQVWTALMRIPAGQPCSYQDVALMIGRKTATRAVARANSSNQLALVIPCHRVIKADGSVGGYAGHVHRKQWLLGHEA